MDGIGIEQITDLFKCKFCQKCYENPIVLPCGDKICKNDLNKLYSQVTVSGKTDTPQLKCPNCKETIQIPKKGFPVDREMKKLIEIGLDKLTFGEVFDKSKNSVQNLSKKLTELETLWNEPKTFIQNYFTKLRDQLDEKREELIVKIDKNYEKLVKEINGYETECIKVVDAEEVEKKIENELKTSRDSLAEYEEKLNSLTVDEEEWEEITLKAKFLRLKLNDVMRDLEDMFLQYKTYEFNEVEDIEFSESFFRSLKVKKIHKSKNSNLDVYKFLCSNFQEFSYFINSKSSSKDFQIEDFKWRFQIKNNNEDFLSCYLFCDLEDAKAVEATFQIELINRLDQHDNEKLIGRTRFTCNSNGYGKAHFISFKEIFDNGFYDQKSDSIEVNIYVQIDSIEDY